MYGCTAQTIVERAGLVVGAAEFLAGQQHIDPFRAVRVGEPVRRAVVVAPRDGLARSDRRGSRARTRNSRSTRWSPAAALAADALNDDLARRVAHRESLVVVPVARSTMVTSFEPSLVTYTGLAVGASRPPSAAACRRRSSAAARSSPDRTATIRPVPGRRPCPRTRRGTARRCAATRPWESCATTLSDAGSSTCTALTPASVKYSARPSKPNSRSRGGLSSATVRNTDASRESTTTSAKLPGSCEATYATCAIGTHRDRVRFRDRDGPDDRIGCGVDEGDPVVAVDTDQQRAAVRRHRQAVRRLADLDRARDRVGRRVDHADARTRRRR